MHIISFVVCLSMFVCRYWLQGVTVGRSFWRRDPDGWWEGGGGDGDHFCRGLFQGTLFPRGPNSEWGSHKRQLHPLLVALHPNLSALQPWQEEPSIQELNQSRHRDLAMTPKLQVWKWNQKWNFFKEGFLDQLIIYDILYMYILRCTGDASSLPQPPVV